MAVKTLAQAQDARLIKLCDRANALLLYLLFFTIPLFFVIYTRDQFELPKLTLLRVLTIIMLGVWLIRVLAARRVAFRTTPLDIPLLAWLGLQVLTLFSSVSLYISWLGEYENFRGLLTVGNYFVLFYLAVNFIRSRQQIDHLLMAILLSGLLVTAYGISQFLGVDFIYWNPTSIAKGRYFSTLGNPNFLAAYLAMVMPLLVIFFVETRSLFKRLLLFVSFTGMFFALMGTWSRGGFLGLVAALLVLVGFGLVQGIQQLRAASRQAGLGAGAWLGQMLRQHRTWVIFLGLTLGILVLISATFGRHHMVRVYSSIVHIQDAVKVSRLHIWGPGLQIFLHHPILGTGLDTFKTMFPQYATPAFAAIDGANVASRTAHNEILQVLATQGLIGLAVVAWLTIAFLRIWWLAYRRSRQVWRDRLILVGLLGSWLAYSVQNIFSFGVAAIDTFYWLILALTVLLSISPEEQALRAPAQTPAEPSRPFVNFLSRNRSWVMLLVAAAVAWSSWQACRVFLADLAYNRGSILRLQGQLDATQAEYTRAAALVPSEVKYLVYEGLAFEEKAKAATDKETQKKYIAHAIELYRRSLKLNPVNAYYLGNLGRAYGFAALLEDDPTPDFDLAAEYYRRAIAAAPVTVLFYHNLAMLYLTRNQVKEFDELMERLAAFDPGEASRLAFTAGNNYYNLRDLPLAKEYYDRALALNPDYPEARYNLGVTLVQLGNLRDALTQWRQALELKPDFEPARQMLLRYHSRTGSQAASGGDFILHH